MRQQAHLGIRQLPFESVIADESNTGFDGVPYDESGATGIKTSDSLGFQRCPEDGYRAFSLGTCRISFL